MTTFVLVHGAWHGSWAWDRVAALLRAEGAEVVAPDLTADRDVGLQTHVDEVVAALDALPDGRAVVLVGHSYAGLVVRQAADQRPERVTRLVLVDGWAGADGASLLGLAPDWFGDAVRSAAATFGNGYAIPSPGPAAFGIDEPSTAAWLAERLRPHPLRTFTEPTRLGGAVDRIPGTGICCCPPVFPFAELALGLGYDVVEVNGPHDILLSDPEALVAALAAGPQRLSRRA